LFFQKSQKHFFFSFHSTIKDIPSIQNAWDKVRQELHRIGQQHSKLAWFLQEIIKPLSDVASKDPHILALLAKGQQTLTDLNKAKSRISLTNYARDAPELQRR
jgi:hypothetical protein